MKVTPCSRPDFYNAAKKKLTMRDLNIIITLCLNIGLSSSKDVPSHCHGVENGLCGRGQHVLFTDNSEFSCVDCPLGTYLDFASHNCEACISHSHPHLKEVIIEQGSTRRDNVIICKQGYFRRQSHSSKRRRGGCEKCSVCKEGAWEVQTCNEEEDTMCCRNGIVAGNRGVRVVCVLSQSTVPRKEMSLRKERASGSNENNTSVLIDDKPEKANISLLRESHHEDQSNSYPRTYYRFQKNKVEFPEWAKILCACVPVMVFLCYLGVGIPCNACGSQDKLRIFINWALKRSRSRCGRVTFRSPADSKAVGSLPGEAEFVSKTRLAPRST